MKHLNEFITEKFKINKNTTTDKYSYFPEDIHELRDIITEKLYNDEQDLNDIDISKIEDMSNLFAEIEIGPGKIDISKWDVSNVVDMHGMFMGCDDLRCDVSKWNVSNVEDMSAMFMECLNFNCDLSKWNVSKCKNMEYMFEYCEKLNTNLNKWDVRMVHNMHKMFNNCKSMKNIPRWYIGL